MHIGSTRFGNKLSGFPHKYIATRSLFRFETVPLPPATKTQIFCGSKMLCSFAEYLSIFSYLFFWQASQEVEEEKAMGRRMRVQRQGATSKEIKDRKLDVGVGTFFSNLVMYFHYINYRANASCPRDHKHRDIQSSCQGSRPARGKIRRDSFHARDCRCRITCHSDPDRLGRVCLCRKLFTGGKGLTKNSNPLEPSITLSSSRP